MLVQLTGGETMPVTTVEIVSKAVMAPAGSTSVKAYNVFHYQITTPGGAPAIADVLTTWLAAVSPTWALATVARFNQLFVEGRFLDDANNLAVSIAGFGVGSIATDGLPSNETVYMLYQSAIRSRKARGNKKFAGAAEASTTGDILNAGGVTLWGNFRAALFANFPDSNGNTWTPGVLSRQPPAVYKTNPVTIVFNPCQSVLLNQRIGRLKRRSAASVY